MNLFNFQYVNMLDAYFFVPADKEKFLSKVSSLNVDYIVYDLEDAVPLNNKKKAFDVLMSMDVDSNHYVRIPNSGSIYSDDQIKQLFEKFKLIERK